MEVKLSPRSVNAVNVALAQRLNNALTTCDDKLLQRSGSVVTILRPELKGTYVAKLY